MFQPTGLTQWRSWLVFAFFAVGMLGCRPAADQGRRGTQRNANETAAISPGSPPNQEILQVGSAGQLTATPPASEDSAPQPNTPGGWVTEAPPHFEAGGADQEGKSGWIVPDQPPLSALPHGEGRPHPIESPPSTPLPSTFSAPGAESSPGTSPQEGPAQGVFPNPLRGNQVPAGGPQVSVPPGTKGSFQPPAAPGSGEETSSRPTVSKAPDRRLERPPFDPIKENGRFFVGWTKPQLALIFTGNQDGYFEPCGCAGKERMKGGLSRRHTMIEQLRQQGWPVVVMDLGGLIKGFGKQTEVKFQVTVDALRRIGYDVINLGRNDLRLPAPLLLSVIAPTSGERSEFVSANVALFDFDTDQWTNRFRVIEAGGKRVGVTAILGKSYHEEIHNPDLAFLEPALALAKVVPQLKEHADILVLLAHAPRDEAFALVKQFPDFDVLALSDGPAEPPGAPQYVPDTKTMLVFVGEKAMTAIVLGFFDRPEQPIAYQRVILDSRYPDSPAMKEMMLSYQMQLQALGLDGLEIRLASHPRREIQGEFVGSEKCASCHEESYRIWKRSGHSRAWETLVKLDPPRNFDPECISCHVTGWHPTRYFPYLSGFLSEEKTPHLINVGCESCHGPGGEHVAAEMGSDLDRQRRAAEAMIVTKEEVENSEAHSCRNCHDLDNSPEFDFSTYWPLVEHYEKE
ncbi:MAG: multiheme c-type cytochrome [Thermogutta sp.]